MRAVRTLLVVVAFIAAPALALAQQTESRITGRVLDQSQAALPGVTVTVTSKSTGAVRTDVTDGEGNYAVTNLGPGTYTVAIELSGFAPKTRDVVLGVGQSEKVEVELGVAALTENVTVNAAAPVLDLSSAKIGVNVSPEEVENLPVNGRNFANLMTLATGATSDGNGGWASVRFNGKSNQQNYLNYDGVDGTYVWDASPGYLNSTGSQFRLQTSMESVAEFRVNSGLAPAESGLGAGGNITVVSKSGSNAFRGSLFEYIRNDALDSATKYVGADGKREAKQPLELNQFGGSIGGPVKSNKSFFFFSFEGLRQTTGLSFTEAVPSDETIRRILAGEPVGSGAGQSAARTQAVAPLLSGFPRAATGTANALVGLASAHQRSGADENTLSFRVDHRFSDRQSFYARYLFSDGEIDTPDRTVTRAPRPRRAAPAELRVQPPVGAGQQLRQRVQVRLQRPADQRRRVQQPGQLRPGRRVAVRHVHLVVDRRARQHRHRAQRPVDSRHLGLDHDRLGVRPALAVGQQRDDLDARHAHREERLRVPEDPVGLPVPRQHRDHLQQRQRLHRQPPGRGRGGARFAGVQAAAVLRDRLRAGFVERHRSPDARPRPALRLLLGGEGSRRPGAPVLRRGQRVRSRRLALLRRRQEQLLAAPVGGLRDQRQDGAARRLRLVLRPRPVRGSHPADRELHRAPPRADGRRPEQRPAVSGARRHSSPTCSRFAATRTTTRTNTTCSTASACRASCPARST